MKILIVDDQRAIVESIRDGISWEALAIDQVYTATSAKEAKLILVNFDIDILLTDIEMPEEDGLELFRWTRQRFPELIGIFLTSHADFAYAKEAIRLGGLDYILQPARYEDVERVLKKAVEKACQYDRIRKLERTTKLIVQQRDSILELMLAKGRLGKWDEVQELVQQLGVLFDMEYEHCSFLPLWVQVVSIAKSSRWTEEFIKIALRNVLEELLEDAHVNVCAASETDSDYLLLVAAEEGAISDKQWRQGLEEFVRFLNAHMDFAIAVYPEVEASDGFRKERIQALRERRKSNIQKKAQIFWEDVEKEADLTVNEDRIQMAVDYIRNNISRTISRLEVAEMLHLNEEYFSRLFKRYTGYTFKDYETMERIRQAKKLLEYSGFSISIIASKVGYDNFSHFSKVFKKMTGSTPQEYRKEKQQKKSHKITNESR